MKTQTKWLIGGAAVAALFIVFVITFAGYALSTYNTQQKLGNLYTAKVDANKADLSNLKSKLPEAASVTTEQMEQLGKLFNNYAAARTPAASGAIMNWVQESVPNIDQSTFRNLQNIIVATRDGWTERQKELVDISRVYNTNLDTQPSGLILKIFGDFERIKPIVIVTTDTSRAFETGVDEPAVLFRK
jgi:hypothetical protein